MGKAVPLQVPRKEIGYIMSIADGKFDVAFTFKEQEGEGLIAQGIKELISIDPKNIFFYPDFQHKLPVNDLDNCLCRKMGKSRVVVLLYNTDYGKKIEGSTEYAFKEMRTIVNRYNSDEKNWLVLVTMNDSIKPPSWFNAGRDRYFPLADYKKSGIANYVHELLNIRKDAIENDGDKITDIRQVETEFTIREAAALAAGALPALFMYGLFDQLIATVKDRNRYNAYCEFLKGACSNNEIKPCGRKLENGLFKNETVSFKKQDIPNLFKKHQINDEYFNPA
jgi:hypothetical protein